MPDTASKMPAALRIGAVGGPTTYIRTDIVERMAEALEEIEGAATEASVRNEAARILSAAIHKSRAALNSYREASNDKA